ncbi:MAG: apolipoprotein N-acyltransferase [Limisphaerales bacterium]
MRSIWSNPLFRSRYPLAIVAGLVLSAAFPDLGVAGLAWVAPGMMLAVALGKDSGETFRIGYVGGLSHYLSMLYWLLLIPYRWHGVPLAPALGWLALSAFLALFPATWVWLIAGAQVRPNHRVAASGPGDAEAGDEPQASIPPRTWAGRVVWALAGAAIWVALEMILARILGGFPWELLGASQYRMVPLIQLASVTGVYGVSFLVIWLSLSLLSAGLMVIRRPTARSIWVAELFLPIVVIAVLFNLGLRRAAHEPAPVRTLKAILVQPSVPQTLIWDAAKNDQRFQGLLRLSEEALSQHTADLMIWPEAAVPKLLRYDQATFDAITGLARRHHTWLIVGSDDAEPRRNPSNPDDADYFNSSFLISPEGRLVQRYIKRNLVIFGEYIPLLDWFPFLTYFTPIQGGFTPGKGPVQFNLKSLNLQTSVLICFEDTFPQLARTDVGPETDFLVNITNDGWFDHGPAQWQQATTAIFRAVENGLPLIRCSNNGVTCWIDAAGRLRQVFLDEQGSIYGAGYLAADIPLPSPDEPHLLTFYTRHGDWFGWSCVIVAGWLLLRRFARIIRDRPPSLLRALAGFRRAS